jgi:hypothetical protein
MANKNTKAAALAAQPIQKSVQILGNSPAIGKSVEE